LIIAVFPIENLVFFAHTSVPLNIFEPRYKTMVEECIRNNTLVAIAPENPTHEKFGFDALTGEVKGDFYMGAGRLQIIERRPDGTLLIFLDGKNKVRLKKMIQQEPYFIFEVETVRDDDSIGDMNQFNLERLRRLLWGWIEHNLKGQTHQDGFKATVKNTSNMIDLVASIFVNDAATKQAILNMNKYDEKVLFLAGLLDEKGELRPSDSVWN
jgi:Lon protease-like protein